MLADAAREGDTFALSEIDRVARFVGIALANVITLFHPERIAMGGGVSLMGDVLLDPLRRYVADRTFGPFRGRYRILPCELAESVVVVGALLLALHQRSA
jgi:glucokinase